MVRSQTNDDSEKSSPDGLANVQLKEGMMRKGKYKRGARTYITFSLITNENMPNWNGSVKKSEP